MVLAWLRHRARHNEDGFFRIRGYRLLHAWLEENTHIEPRQRVEAIVRWLIKLGYVQQDEDVEDEKRLMVFYVRHEDAGGLP
jgi:hypothetical protein